MPGLGPIDVFDAEYVHGTEARATDQSKRGSRLLAAIIGGGEGHLGAFLVNREAEEHPP